MPYLAVGQNLLDTFLGKKQQLKKGFLGIIGGTVFGMFVCYVGLFLVGFTLWHDFVSVDHQKKNDKKIQKAQALCLPLVIFGIFQRLNLMTMETSLYFRIYST